MRSLLQPQGRKAVLSGLFLTLFACGGPINPSVPFRGFTSPAAARSPALALTQLTCGGEICDSSAQFCLVLLGAGHCRALPTGCDTCECAESDVLCTGAIACNKTGPGLTIHCTP